MKHTRPGAGVRQTQQFAVDGGRVPGGPTRRGAPPHGVHRFPHDIDAGTARRAQTPGSGTRSLTETCETSTHLMVHVDHLGAGRRRRRHARRFTKISASRPAARQAHLDTAYVTPIAMDAAGSTGGPDRPTRPDYDGSPRPNEGFAASDFTIDWDQRRRPSEDRTSTAGRPPWTADTTMIKSILGEGLRVCRPGPVHQAKRRSITVRPRTSARP